MATTPHPSSDKLRREVAGRFRQLRKRADELARIMSVGILLTQFTDVERDLLDDMSLLNEFDRYYMAHVKNRRYEMFSKRKTARKAR